MPTKALHLKSHHRRQMPTVMALQSADGDGSSDDGPWIQLDEVDFDQIEERLDAAIQDFSADVFIPIQIDDYE